MYSKVIVTGSIANDDIMDFPGRFKDYLLEGKLHQINVSFVVDSLEKQLGGTALNISYNIKLARPGFPVVMAGAVGKDGGVFLDFCRKNGIDRAAISKDDNLYTASGKVITDRDDNQIWGFYYGASANGEKIDLTRWADSNCLVVVSANHPKAFLHFQRQAMEIGCDYLYDPGMALSWIKREDLSQGIAGCRYLVGNDYEISKICEYLGTDEPGLRNMMKEQSAMVTTLGSEGVKIKIKKAKEKEITVKAYHTENIKDPTGAGDAWRGGFIAGLAEGLELVDCLKMGNALASFAVESYGTVNHKPTQEDLRKRMLSLS